jgi:hypothetical protein
MSTTSFDFASYICSPVVGQATVECTHTTSATCLSPSFISAFGFSSMIRPLIAIDEHLTPSLLHLQQVRSFK